MTNATETIADSAQSTGAKGQNDTQSALKFITCGSVDDGKSTLIGRLLVDTRAVLQDHLAGVQRQGETDLALLTDGLSAEREQGITIDVAYRYFSTENRKFIIGDAPGHEQYTRNMVTAASSADAAVVLVDATKLDWALQADTVPPPADRGHGLLPQTRRHSLLLKLLRVPSIVFAVNKLDAVADAALAFGHIRAALQAFAASAGLDVTAIVPVSALKGWNVVDAPQEAGWCGYGGPTLLDILEHLPVTKADTALPLAFPVQWVEKFSSSSDTSQGRRVFWGRVAAGDVQVGDAVRVFPSGQSAVVAQVLNHARQPGAIAAGHSAGIVLDREVDVSRGDWLLAEASDTALQPQRELRATVAWLDDEPLVAGRVYWALHGHRWVKAKIKRIVHKLNIHTLGEEDATQLEPNAIGHIELALQEPLITLPFARSRGLGSLILVDTASHKTSGAVLAH
jgi:sulfate adenylyltransferase subunit 1